MNKAELFRETIKAATRLEKAIALAFPAGYVDTLWNELERRNFALA